jgi:hypothetical protein
MGQRIFGVHGIAAAFYEGQLWTHEFARSVEGVVVAASSGSALHGGSLYRHWVFSLQHYRNERCKEAAGNTD